MTGGLNLANHMFGSRTLIWMMSLVASTGVALAQTPRLRTSQDLESFDEVARKLNFIEDGLSDKPGWVLLVVYASIGVGCFLILVGMIYLTRHFCCPAQPSETYMVEGTTPYRNPVNPYSTVDPYNNVVNPYGPSRGNTPSLADFIKANPVKGKENDKDSEDSNHKNRPDGEFEMRRSQAIAGFDKRVSTRRTGEDYGRLDDEARNRIASVRMEGNLQPFGVAKPSNKALRMLGVDEDAIQRPFDEDIQTRMERVARGAGGGIYAPGFATAALGGQIAQGFKERRAKQLERAAARKEREEAAQRVREMSAANAAAAPKSGTASTSTTSKSTPSQPTTKPGPNKLAAFLATNEGNSELPSSKKTTTTKRRDSSDDDDSDDSDDDSSSSDSDDGLNL